LTTFDNSHQLLKNPSRFDSSFQIIIIFKVTGLPITRDLTG